MVAHMVDACEAGNSSRNELAVIAKLWANIQALLLSGSTEAVEQTIRILMAALPQPDMLDAQQLLQLAQLHQSSASSMQAVMRLLAPEAFPQGANTPDEQLLAELDSAVLDMVSCLITVQLFHLQRAAELSAHYRTSLLASQLRSLRSQWARQQCTALSWQLHGKEASTKGA